MNKENEAYINNTISFSYQKKKKEILLFATAWMDLEGTMLCEMSDGDRQIPYDFTCTWNLKQVNRKAVTDNIKTKS